MTNFQRHRAFSLIEVLCALTIILILAGLIVGLGKHVRTHADENLCRSGIEIIALAIDQYYQQHDDRFPFSTNPSPDGDAFFMQNDLKSLLDNDLKALPADSSSITGLEAAPPAKLKDTYSYASSEAMYYYLDKKCVNSRKLISTLSDSFFAVEDVYGTKRQYIVSGASPTGLDLVRFVDPWGNSLRYLYSPGDVYPVIESAGADGDFSTEEDNITSD